ncbi:MAG: SDR family NAD(P)-dependent oxidoreductase [Alphaproteobacteria bacterium]
MITGASAGLGADFARLFAADGYDLVLAARRADPMQVLAAELAGAHGIEATVISIDLARAEAPDELAAAVGAKGLAIDALVNNAGFGALGAFAETDGERQRDMVAVNVAALTRLTRLLLPGMIERREGRIINLASVAGFMPGPYMAVYFATKAYVVSFSAALAEELRGTGVTVTCICPGPTETEFHAVAGMTRPKAGSGATMMPSAPVARAGYAAALRGRRLVVTGAPNKLAVFATRLLPQGVMLRLVRRGIAGR